METGSTSNSCPFCDSRVPALSEKDTAVALKDKYPVTKNHTLIIPRRHIMSIFEMSKSEWIDCFMLLKEMRARIMSEDNTVSGFNIGINDGIDAGQTIGHCHVHLLPRRKGDVENPVGGIRNIIVDKGNYLH